MSCKLGGNELTHLEGDGIGREARRLGGLRRPLPRLAVFGVEAESSPLGRALVHEHTGDLSNVPIEAIHLPRRLVPNRLREVLARRQPSFVRHHA